VTTLAVEPTPRAYTGLTDWCTMCGACAKRCPSGAIDKMAGKSNETCNAYLKSTRSEDGVFYGCGQCQCGVPCESAAPGMG